MLQRSQRPRHPVRAVRISRRGCAARDQHSDPIRIRKSHPHADTHADGQDLDSHAHSDTYTVTSAGVDTDSHPNQDPYQDADPVLEPDADVRLRRYPPRRSTLSMLLETAEGVDSSQAATLQLLRSIQPFARVLTQAGILGDPGVLTMPHSETGF